MRNLKKALALVLALMMTLSLMVTASASDYADGGDIEYDEAVTVMSAIGVFNGTDGGKFDPDGNLTRAQAAKIITYMLLDQKVADSLPNTGSQFADCPDGRWYVGVVNYLTDAGIVAGRSETTFDPNGKVTGIEFGKMLLCALGYDAVKENMVGTASWATNIAILSRLAGLDEDMTTSVLNSNALTREQACQMAFNAEKADVQYYEDNWSVSTPDGTKVESPASRKPLNNKTGNDYRLVKGDRDEYMQFCEMYRQDLKYDKNFGGTDDFGRILNRQWLIGKDDVIYTGSDAPAVVLTNVVSEAALTKMLPKGIEVTVSNAVKNGDAQGNAISDIADIAALAKPGKLVEIYINEDEDEIINVVTVEYRVETVKNITEKNGEVTYNFSASGNKKNTEDATAAVLEGDVNKGDTVTTANIGLYNDQGTKTGSKLYVYPTDSFTGSQTKKNTNTSTGVITVTIGGAEYVLGTNVGGVKAADFANSKDEKTYWADMNGYLVSVKGEADPDPEYAVIVEVLAGTSGASLDNTDGNKVVNVRAILSDGTVEDRTLATSLNPDPVPAGVTLTAGTAAGDLICGNVVVCAKGDLGSYQTKTVENLKDTVFGYTINSDGQMVLADVDGASGDMTADEVYDYTLTNDVMDGDTVTTPGYKGAASDTKGGATALFTKDTVFLVFTKGANNKYTVTKHTGTSGLNLPAIKSDSRVKNAVITASNGTTGAASVVFVCGQVAAAEVDYVYIDIGTIESNVLTDAGKNVYAYTGIKPDGEEITVYTKDNKDVLDASGIYVYDTDNVVSDSSAKKTIAGTPGSPAVSKDNLYDKVVKAEVENNLLKVDNKWMDMTGAQIVYVDDTLDSVAGSNCVVVLAANGDKTPTKVATIYVYETPTAVAATVDKESVSIVGTGTGTITVTCNKTVTVTATSSADAKATATAAGTSVTVTGVAAGSATVTITVTVTGADAEHYTPATFTIPVTVTAS